jgi:hypothetical protein
VPGALSESPASDPRRRPERLAVRKTNDFGTRVPLDVLVDALERIANTLTGR